MREPIKICDSVEMREPEKMREPVGVRELVEMCDSVNAGNSRMDPGSTLVCSTFV